MKNLLPFEIIPTPGTLIVEAYEEKDNSPFIMADSMAKKDSAGVVLAVGIEGVTDFGTNIETNAEVGDIVFFQDFNAMPYYIGGRRIKFVKFNHLLGIQRKNE